LANYKSKKGNVTRVEIKKPSSILLIYLNGLFYTTSCYISV
jgi:hypothetical protein